jgi:hypothetical protein
MAIDGEPKDGDYVRYVEQLINRGNAAPGQVVAQRGIPAVPAPAPSPGEVISNASKSADKSGTLWKTLSERTNATPSSAPPATGSEPTANATLASAASKRRGAFAVALVSIAIAWQAIRMLFEALRQPYFDAHELLPAAFLLVFAGILWKASRSQRTRARQIPGRLQPLSTIANRGTNKPAS